MVRFAVYASATLTPILTAHMSQRLTQYLRQERRRAGFSQADVASLFGARAKTSVSRYERGKHLPALRTALAYEALLGVPVAQLFPAAFREARETVRSHARRHIEMLANRAEDGRRARQQRSIETLLTESDAVA